MVVDNGEGKESEENLRPRELDNTPESNSQIIKKWLIETRTKLKISTTAEYSDYNEALELFNKKSTEGKNIILYEVHKSASDGKTVKKVPILNYSKHLERKKIAEEEETAAAISKAIEEGKAEGSIKKPKPGLRAIKYRIFLLIGIVAAFIVTLFLMDMLAGGGNSARSGHHIILLETMYIELNLEVESFQTIFQKL